MYGLRFLQYFRNPKNIQRGENSTVWKSVVAVSHCANKNVCTSLKLFDPPQYIQHQMNPSSKARCELLANGCDSNYRPAV